MSEFVYTDPRAATPEEQAEWLEKERIRLNNRLEFLRLNPFDPRNEVSADAKHVADRIVKTLWIIFVLLPIVSVVVAMIFIAITAAGVTAAAR